MEIGIEQSEFKGKPVLSLNMKYDNGFSKRISYGTTNWKAITQHIDKIKAWLEEQENKDKAETAKIIEVFGVK